MRLRRRTRPLPSWVPRQASTRLLIASVTGLLVGLVLDPLSRAARSMVAWDVFSLVLLSFAWAIIWTADAGETRRRAANDDPGRSAVWVIVIASSTLSLFAAAFGLRHARALSPSRAAVEVFCCLGAVVLSWCLTHTAWTLRYAHLYYRDDDEGVGGLSFPGEASPDETDFAYFAFTIGMAFQTSDIAVTSPQIRRAVLLHAAQSFLFNTTILALTLNLAYGFLA